MRTYRNYVAALYSLHFFIHARFRSSIIVICCLFIFVVVVFYLLFVVTVINTVWCCLCQRCCWGSKLIAIIQLLIVRRARSNNVLPLQMHARGSFPSTVLTVARVLLESPAILVYTINCQKSAERIGILFYPRLKTSVARL